MAIQIALLGAAGSMGTRASNALGKLPEYHLLHVEGNAAGEAKLKQRGLTPVPLDEALPAADVVIMAIPDRVIKVAAPQIVAKMKSGAMLMSLDPAAPHAGRIPARQDISIFVTHPSHPPLFEEQDSVEGRRDFFGSGRAKQCLVSALMQGPEEDYAQGQQIAAAMWGPVLRSHRVTVHQMALLEPALSETVAATCLTVVREAMDEAIRRGVPPQAARDFLLGHLNIELAILFNEIDWQFSDGAKLAIEEAKKVLFQPDWKKVFEDQHLKHSVQKITGG